MLNQRKKLYQDRFPPVLATRMCDQMDTFHKVNPTNSNGFLALFFCKNIGNTIEGGCFWSQIAELYLNRNTPELPQVLEIFAEHDLAPVFYISAHFDHSDHQQT
jgi:hypothetical protein